MALFHREALALVPISFALGCAPVGPVGHYPWVEDRTRELVAEKLVLEVLDEEVAVDARFEFRGTRGEQTMGFPVPLASGPANDFVAVVAHESGAFTMLPCAKGVPSMLPVPYELESYDIFVPAGALDHGAMHVRYRQRARPRFDYVLASGAYWRGPISRLIVEVIDRGHRLREVRVERIAPDRLGEVMRWDLRDIEPRSGARLELK